MPTSPPRLALPTFVWSSRGNPLPSQLTAGGVGLEVALLIGVLAIGSAAILSVFAGPRIGMLLASVL